MLRIRRLHSEPGLFDPIDFTPGVNLILGETTRGSAKTNAVGKSLAIEFMSFGLMKELRHSRLRLIPEDVLPLDALICLEFEVSGHVLESRRSVEGHDHPVIVDDGRVTEYASLDDATRHLSTLLFGMANERSVPSFRAMMGPLIRDERSEFKSMVKCYDTELRIPPDYTPHLFLLGIDAGPYKDAQRVAAEVKRVGTAEQKARNDIEALTGKKVREARAELNELTGQVERVKREIDSLENVAGYEMVRDEVVELEGLLENERAHQAVLKANLSRIDMFRGDAYIDTEEVGDLYEQFKSGLGELIKRDLDEVTAFKLKIDEFQRSLVGERRDSLVRDLRETDARISQLDRRYRAKLAIIDQSGALKNLRQTLEVHRQKAEEQAALSTFITRQSEYEREKKSLQADRSASIQLLDSYVDNAGPTIASVEGTILDIHEYVAGNRQSSFDVEVGRDAEIVKLNLRIDDDGSHSVEREKVFMYDAAMLLNDAVSTRHPGLLVHDNIFDVDKDTLIRSLNYLGENPGLLAGRQYILTLNRDELGAEEVRALRLDLDGCTRAAYTKNSKFLRADYQELSET